MLFLKCLAQAISERGLKLVTDVVPFGNTLHEIARNTWEYYTRQRQVDHLRGEIEQLAQSSPQQIRDEAEKAVADLPTEVRTPIMLYLQQVPGVIHRTLRRPDDPTGKTLPDQLTFQKSDDLIAFLPERMPRFKPGDHPLPGVDWELVELLGVGGFGEVWKARNPHLPGLPPVALKFCIDATSRERLLTHEARIISQVMTRGSHPGIVVLRQAYMKADPPCLEYEYIGGGDLAGLIRDWFSKGTPAITKVRQTFMPLVEAVAFAHGASPPIVHRDLKPANILIAGTSFDQPILKIADFGIGGVMAAQQIDLTTRGTMHVDLLVTGLRGSHTMLYASPQQVRGEAPDPRDDIHALGVIWYQMLTGDLSQGAPTGMAWTAELTKRGMSQQELQLLGSCIESNATRRPKDANELLVKLQTLTSDVPRTKKAPIGEVEPPSNASTKAIFAVVIGAVLIMFGLAIAWRTGPQAVTKAAGTAPKGSEQVTTPAGFVVSGQVRVILPDGKNAGLIPVGGEIIIQSPSHGPFTTPINKGFYRLDGIPSGEYRVAVSPEVLKVLEGKMSNRYARYTKYQATPLMINVQSGNLEHDIELHALVESE